jgi:hypothetical protein
MRSRASDEIGLVEEENLNGLPAHTLVVERDAVGTKVNRGQGEMQIGHRGVILRERRRN